MSETTAPNTATASAHADLLIRFHQAMDDADFDTALSCFAQDAVVIRPKMLAPNTLQGESPLLEDRGHAQIRAFYEARGKRDTRHDLSDISVTGDHAYAEGLITVGGKESGQQSAPFLCHATFNAEGKISRFLAIR